MDPLTVVSLRLPNELLADIQKRADEKKQRVSQYLRHLIELGLRIEDLSDSPDEKKNLEALVYKMVIETGLLCRSMIKEDQNMAAETRDKILRQNALKAQEIVEYHLGEEIFKKESSRPGG